jgi:hypothetical protein
VLLVAAVGAVSLARTGRRRNDGGPTFEELIDDDQPLEHELDADSPASSLLTKPAEHEVSP